MHSRALCTLLLASPLAALRSQAPVITSAGDPSVKNDSIYGLTVDPAKHRGEGFVILLDDGVERMDPGGKGTRTYRSVVQLLDLKGARAWRFQTFHYDPAFGRIRLNWARVVNPNGSVVEATPDRVRDERPPKDDKRHAHAGELWLALRGAEPGTIVDVSWTVENDSAWFGNDVPNAWRVNGGDAVIMRSRLIVDVPDSMPLHITERNLGFARRESSANGRHTYVWSTRDVPRLVFEPFASDSNDAFRTISFHSLPSWDLIGKWYGARVNDRIVIGGKTQKKLAARVAGARTWSDSVHAVYRWAAQEVFPREIEFQESGFQAQLPDQTLEDVLGDSQDKSVLLVALLRHIKVDAALVLDIAPSPIAEQTPLLAMLRGVLVRITHGADTIFVDPLAPFLPLGILPREVQGDLAIVIPADGRAALTHLPQDSVGANLVQRTIVGRMDSAGLVTWRHTVRLTGITQALARAAFASQRDSSAHKFELEEDARRDLPDGVGDSLVYFDGRDLRATAEFSFTVKNGRVPTKGQATMLRLPWGDFTRYVAAELWLSQHTPRQWPINVSEIGGDTVVAVDLRLTLPPGWKAELPPGVNAASPFGTVVRTYAQEGRVLHLTQRVAGARGTVPAARANDVIAWLRTVTEYRAQYIVIRHTGG